MAQQQEFLGFVSVEIWSHILVVGPLLMRLKSGCFWRVCFAAILCRTVVCKNAHAITVWATHNLPIYSHSASIIHKSLLPPSCFIMCSARSKAQKIKGRACFQKKALKKQGNHVNNFWVPCLSSPRYRNSAVDGALVSTLRGNTTSVIASK